MSHVHRREVEWAVKPRRAKTRCIALVIHRHAAFTLTELLVVCAILVTSSVLFFPRLVGFYQEQKLRQAAIELQSLLFRGRTLAQRLQGNCGLTISNNGGVQVLTTPAADFSGTNLCTADTLSPLNLSQISEVRGLNVSRDITTASNITTSSSCPSGTPCRLEFIPLGVLSGDRQTFFLSGASTSAQFCVDVSLTLIRVGFRNGSSGACTYTRL